MNDAMNQTQKKKGGHLPEILRPLPNRRPRSFWHETIGWDDNRGVLEECGGVLKTEGCRINALCTGTINDHKEIVYTASEIAGHLQEVVDALDAIIYTIYYGGEDT